MLDLVYYKRIPEWERERETKCWICHFISILFVCLFGWLWLSNQHMKNKNKKKILVHHIQTTTLDGYGCMWQVVTIFFLLSVPTLRYGCGCCGWKNVNYLSIDHHGIYCGLWTSFIVQSSSSSLKNKKKSPPFWKYFLFVATKNEAFYPFFFEFDICIVIVGLQISSLWQIFLLLCTESLSLHHH